MVLLCIARPNNNTLTHPQFIQRNGNVLVFRVVNNNNDKNINGYILQKPNLTLLIRQIFSMIGK